MRELFVLVVHLLAVLIKLVQPGSVRSVVAESLLLKHQLLTLDVAVINQFYTPSWVVKTLVDNTLGRLWPM